ncbi:A24 family peptidase [Burkholderia gladioli pv. alliicola]|uniref:prepilin peptidase n=1 Tax=Burkholderia gladioli TaxID=28095 RepID=UPI003D81479D
MTWLWFLLLGSVSGILSTLVALHLPAAIERDAAAEHARFDPRRARRSCAYRGWATACLADAGHIAFLLPRLVATCMIAALCACAAFGPTPAGWAASLLGACLATAGAIDLEHHLLPDAITLPLLWAGLALNLAEVFAPLPDAVVGAMVGYLLPWMLGQLFRLLRGLEGMGYGDFKLLAALGAWLGWEAVPWIIALSSVAGAIVAIALIAGGCKKAAEPIPFGPFIALAAIAVIYWPFVSPHLLQ